MTEMPSTQRISAGSISLRACGLVSAAEIPPFPAIGLGLVPTFGQKRPPPEGSGVLCILDERLGKRVNSKRCELDATNRSNIGEISNV